MATKRDLTVKRGDTTSWDIILKDVDGNVIDLTNCVIYMTVKSEYSYDDDHSIFQKRIDNVPNPELGIATIKVSNLENDIPPKNYYYDIQITDSYGNVTTLFEGKYIIEADVTRRYL